ncbi:MAG: 30S ribosome-binding factor RbfA, partial [Candidatus Dadabacteria bacterium]
MYEGLAPCPDLGHMHKASGRACSYDRRSRRAPVGHRSKPPRARSGEPMRTTPRTRRVADQIQRDLAEILHTELKDPRVRMVTITGVEVSADLAHAKVYFSALADAATKQLPLAFALSKLKPVFEDPDIRKIGQNLKYEIVVLERNGIMLKGISFDTMIAAHMLDSSRLSYSLDELSRVYLGHLMISYKDVTGSGKTRIPFDEVEIEKAKTYSCEDSDVAMILYKKLEPELEKAGLIDVYGETELKFIGVLARIEMNGVRVDPVKLKELSEEFESGLKELEKEIYAEVG